MKLREFIREQFKRRLAAGGCLVIYDAEGRYRECASQVATDACAFIDAGESIITAREQALTDWFTMGFMNEHSELTGSLPKTPVNGENHDAKCGHPETANRYECGNGEAVGAVVTNRPKHRRKRTPRQRQEDLETIAEWSAKGWTQAEIAEGISATRSYTLSRSQIRFDLQQIDKMGRERFSGSIADLRRKELARIEQIEDAALEGWKRSLEDRTLSVVNSSGIPECGGQKRDSCHRRETGIPDSSFLKVLVELEKLQCKLLGLLNFPPGRESPPPPQKLTAGDLGVEVGSRWNGGLGMRSQRSNG